MMRVLAADIGGTHARFAVATCVDGEISLAHEIVFDTARYTNLPNAWGAYRAHVGLPLPNAAALAVAAPVSGEVLKFTNSPWEIRPGSLRRELGLDDLTLINDFAAVAHAVAILPDNQFKPLCGPQVPLPSEGVISIIGPGTGLGVAQLIRHGGRAEVVATEGGHIGFAPHDPVEDQILAHLRLRHTRVSAERLASGPGLMNIYAAMAAPEERPLRFTDDKALWEAATAGGDQLAVAALERFCLCLGGFAGDIALAHGAHGAVIGGGVGQRLADILPQSGFVRRFAAKGRFETMMAGMPVKLVTHPAPGLIGAAAAFFAGAGRI